MSAPGEIARSIPRCPAAYGFGGGSNSETIRTGGAIGGNHVGVCARVVAKSGEAYVPEFGASGAAMGETGVDVVVVIMGGVEVVVDAGRVVIVVVAVVVVLGGVVAVMGVVASAGTGVISAKAGFRRAAPLSVAGAKLTLNAATTRTPDAIHR